MILSFVNIKGGVGKTTLAYLLATSINQVTGKEHKILVIDTDPQANITSKFMFDQHREIVQDSNIAHFFEDSQPIQKVILQSKFDEIHLIPSHVSLAILEPKLMAQIRGITKLKRGIEELKDNYDIFLIDCPPNVGAFTANAVIASDYVIIPMSIDTLSLQGFTYTYNFIEEAKDINPNVKILGAVANLADKRTAAHRMLLDKFKRQLGNYMLDIVISRRTAFQRAVDLGKRPLDIIGAEDKNAKKDLIAYVSAVMVRMKG